MHKLTAQPFVKDVLDLVALAAILNANPYWMGIAKELLEALPVSHLWIAPSSSGRKCDERKEECPLAPAFLPKKVRAS